MPRFVRMPARFSKRCQRTEVRWNSCSTATLLWRPCLMQRRLPTIGNSWLLQQSSHRCTHTSTSLASPCASDSGKSFGTNIRNLCSYVHMLNLHVLQVQAFLKQQQKQHGNEEASWTSNTICYFTSILHCFFTSATKNESIKTHCTVLQGWTILVSKKQTQELHHFAVRCANCLVWLCLLALVTVPTLLGLLYIYMSASPEIIVPNTIPGTITTGDTQNDLSFGLALCGIGILLACVACLKNHGVPFENRSSDPMEPIFCVHYMISQLQYLLGIWHLRLFLGNFFTNPSNFGNKKHIHQFETSLC